MNARMVRHRFAFALSVVAAAAVLRASGPAGPEPLLLSNARILDVRAGRYLPPATVFINGDRIQSIDASGPASLPPNTRRVDLNGATLVPGLGDMHASASPDNSADADFYYAMALAHGVTEFRVVGARLPWAASQRKRAATGEILAPRLSVGGLRLEQQPASSFSVRSVADVQAARREVAQQASLGAEWVSGGSSIKPDVYRAVVAAARAGKLRVSGEPGATPLAELFRIGVDAVDRIGFFARSAEDCEKDLRAQPDFPQNRDGVGDYLWQHASAADLKPVVPRAAMARTTVIPMLASFSGVLDAEALQGDAALAALPARWREAVTGRAHLANWAGAAAAGQAAAARARLVKALSAAGVRLATGVDTESGGYGVHGAGIHRELSMLVRAGLTPVEAIRAATLNCAEMLGAAASLGQVKAGFKADLFAVEGDPLTNIDDLRKITLVVRGGELLSPRDLLAQAGRAVR